MGKRLDQQPMYPQYTYYYPHYLQTKVRLAGPGAWRGWRAEPRQLRARLFGDFSVSFSGLLSRRGELVGRKQA